MKVTNADLKKFDTMLRRAAREQSEVEVNLTNTKRGYILFANWHPSYADETPEHFAEGEIALIIDGVSGIAKI